MDLQGVQEGIAIIILGGIIREDRTIAPIGLPHPHFQVDQHEYFLLFFENEMSLIIDPDNC